MERVVLSHPRPAGMQMLGGIVVVDQQPSLHLVSSRNNSHRTQQHRRECQLRNYALLPTVLDSIPVVWRGRTSNVLPPISVMGHSTPIPNPLQQQHLYRQRHLLDQTIPNRACSKRRQCERLQCEMPNNPPWLKSTRRSRPKRPMRRPVDRKRSKSASLMNKCGVSVKNTRSVAWRSKWQISSGDSNKKF